MSAIPYTPLPLTHPARAYVPADDTTAEHLAEVFEQHAPILVCGIGEIRDDYEITDQADYLERAGAFK